MSTASWEEDYFVPHMWALAWKLGDKGTQNLLVPTTEGGLPEEIFYFALNEQS